MSILLILLSITLNIILSLDVLICSVCSIIRFACGANLPVIPKEISSPWETSPGELLLYTFMYIPYTFPLNFALYAITSASFTSHPNFLKKKRISSGGVHFSKTCFTPSILTFSPNDLSKYFLTGPSKKNIPLFLLGYNNYYEKPVEQG